MAACQTLLPVMWVTWRRDRDHEVRESVNVMMGELASTSSSLFVSTCSGSDIESHFTTDTGSTSTQVKQFLARLQALRRSELTQKQQIRRNCGLIVKKKNPSCSTDPSSVTPLQQVQKFPGDALSVSAGKLFCTARRKKLSLTKHCYDAHKGDQALSWEKRSWAKVCDSVTLLKLSLTTIRRSNM